MGFDKVKMKQIRNTILLIAALMLGLKYSDQLFIAMGVCLRIIKPFLIGGVVAFVLNIPLRGIENKLLRKWNGKSAKKFKRPVSILLSVLFVILIVNIVIMSVVPQLGKTIVELSNAFPAFAERVMGDLEALAREYPQIQDYVVQLENMEIDWQSIVNSVIDFMKNGMTNLLSSTVTVASNIAGGIMNAAISFIFAIYILGQKEKLQNQFTRLIKAYLPYKVNEKIMKVCALLYQNFSNFITGQCLEAVILGSLFVIAMLIFQMPYAVMVGVLIAFTALIPIVGAFIGCIVGAFLILVINPMKAVGFVVMFLILQQIEGNLIYPKVVGNKVGLPSIWVLMAVTVGGSLFGIAGMLFFIPLVSTVYMLLRDGVNSRESIKNNYKRNNNRRQYNGKYYKSNNVKTNIDNNKE